MPRFGLAFVALFALLLNVQAAMACTFASGQIQINWDVGTTVPGGCSGINVSQGTYGLTMSIPVQGSPAAGLTIMASAANVKIERITITPQPIANGPGQHVINVHLFRDLSVTNSSISWLGTIERSGPYGELQISPVTVEGDIGTPGGVGDTTAYSISGVVIGAITANGNIAGSIVAANGVNTSLGARGQVSTVKSIAGNITSNVLADSKILFVIAQAGNIGTSTTNTTITAAGDIAQVTAKAI